MKRSKYLVFGILSMLMFCLRVSAAPTYSFYTSSGSVENGKSVTATVELKGTASWNVSILSAGNTNGCSQSFADATSNGNNTTKYLSVTCKATSIGAISFTLTGDITSSDGSNINVSASKRVSVVEPRPASQNNYLASLSVGDYELTPKFNEEITEYSVSVPSTVDEVNIDAKVKDKYASLTGIGTFQVNEGSNVFKIVVTAENGKTKEYSVNVNVEDLNPIELNVENGKYTLIKNIKNIEVPELFNESSTLVNGVEVPSFVSDVVPFVLIAVKDGNGKIVYVIKNDDESYDLYKTKKIGNVIFYFMEKDGEFKNYEKSLLEFEDFDVNAYQSNTNADYYVVYGMNLMNGNADWYKYDSKESTLQRYEEVISEKEMDKNYIIVMSLFGGGLFLSVIIIIVLLSSKSKVKIKEVVKEVKVEKNEDKEKELDLVKEASKKLEELEKEKKEKEEKAEEVVEEIINDTKEEETYYLFEKDRKKNKKK